jgi:putative Ca2+/H+ antiporter (TMEM165/GDT1 family)
MSKQQVLFIGLAARLTAIPVVITMAVATSANECLSSAAESSARALLPSRTTKISNAGLLFVDIIFFHLLQRRLLSEQPRPSPVLCHKLAKAADVRFRLSIQTTGCHADACGAKMNSKRGALPTFFTLSQPRCPPRAVEKYLNGKY